MWHRKRKFIFLSHRTTCINKHNQPVILNENKSMLHSLLILQWITEIQYTLR